MPGRRIRWALLALAWVIAASLAGVAEAQEGQPEMTPEMQAEMEAWMKLAQPGEHHQHLAPLVGKWKGRISMWMAPDSEPMINEGTVEIAWIMGNRYLESKHSGIFSGMPFEGRAIEGFNNGENRYESMWIDNFGTVILYYTGSCSEEGKVRVMSSSFTDPMTGGKVLYKAVYKWTDPDHFTYVAYLDKGDGEFKNMEIQYERQ